MFLCLQAQGQGAGRAFQHGRLQAPQLTGCRHLQRRQHTANPLRGSSLCLAAGGGQPPSGGDSGKPPVGPNDDGSEGTGESDDEDEFLGLNEVSMSQLSLN